MSRQLENSPGNRTGSTAAVQATEIASAVEVFNQRLDLGCPNVVRVAWASAQKITFSVFLISMQHAGVRGKRKMAAWNDEDMLKLLTA